MDIFSQKDKYPNNRDKFNEQNAGKPDAAGQAITELLNELVVLSGIGTCALVKSLFSPYAPLTLISLGGIIWAGYYISTEAILFQLLYDLEPSIFTPERIHALIWSP